MKLTKTQRKAIITSPNAPEDKSSVNAYIENIIIPHLKDASWVDICDYEAVLCYDDGEHYLYEDQPLIDLLHARWVVSFSKQDDAKLRKFVLSRFVDRIWDCQEDIYTRSIEGVSINGITSYREFIGED